MFPATQTLQKEMIPLVDRDGICKPTLQIVVEEALASGIEQVLIITRPGQELLLQQHFRALEDDELAVYADKPAALAQAERLAEMEQRISYALQPAPEGYGHAVYCAREFVGNQPFLLLLGDHVYIASPPAPSPRAPAGLGRGGVERRCARQLLDVFERYGCPLSGVQRTAADELCHFGTVAGDPLPDRPGLWQARALYEKPTPEYAREHLRSPGLPEETYLTFLGMHVFTPDIFDCLEEMIREGRRERGEYQLTTAQEMLRSRRRYLAAEVQGSRHDMGHPAGLIETQRALRGIDKR
jgi:UTP--glucose-1-phosphate uridylyltransferase